MQEGWDGRWQREVQQFPYLKKWLHVVDIHDEPLQVGEYHLEYSIGCAQGCMHGVGWGGDGRWPGIKNDTILCSTACGTAKIRLHFREAEVPLPLRISASENAHNTLHFLQRTKKIRVSNFHNYSRNNTLFFLLPLAEMYILLCISSSGHKITAYLTFKSIRGTTHFLSYYR